MQQYAGPLNPGDMAIRANELSPGISALLMKQMRNSAGSGIYQLPVAKQPNPDFYNSALDNVQNNIRTAARTVNAMAPEGERLAYINPQEEGILRLLGGSGEPEPVTGIPSYAPPGAGPLSSAQKAFKEKYSTPSKSYDAGKDLAKAMQDRKDQRDKEREDIQAIVNQAYKDTGVSVSDEGRIQFASDPSKYVDGMYRYDKDSKEPGTGSLGASQLSALDKYIDRDIPLKDDRLMQTLAAAQLYGDKGFFTSDYNKELQKALGRMGLGGENIFGTYLTPEGRDYYQGLGGGSSGLSDLGDKISDFGIFGLAKKLFGGDPEELSIKDRMERAKRAREALERSQSRGDRDEPTPSTASEEATEEEEEEEDILDFFDYYRRFKQPMSYEDIIKRAYEGSSGPLLESFQEAIDREQE